MVTRLAALTALSVMLPLAPAFAADDPPETASAKVVWGEGVAQPAASMPRPMVLSTLYASYAALQAFDAYSTQRAISHGAREANPLMQPVVHQQATFWAMKTSATIGTIVAAERLWRQNRKGAAIAVLVASNAVAAVVAARNARALRAPR
jgi:hypothetical protein